MIELYNLLLKDDLRLKPFIKGVGDTASSRHDRSDVSLGTSPVQNMHDECFLMPHSSAGVFL